MRHILAYHAVADGWEFSAATVSPCRFREHCAALAEWGWRGVRLDEARLGTDDCTFGITVDDAYASLVTVILPECARHGWRGTAFVPTKLVGSDGTWDVGAWRKHRHLDWSGLREVLAAGWEIGAHGASHRALTDMPNDAAERELCDARQEIEQRLGCAATSLAYPFGAASAEVVALAKSTGYARAVTMRPGAVAEETDLWRLPRWPVYRMDRPEHLLVRLGGPRWVYRLEQTRVWTIQQFAQGTRVRMSGRMR